MLQLVTRLDSMQRTQELLVDAIVNRESSTITTDDNRATGNVNRISESVSMPIENPTEESNPKPGTPSRDRCVCHCTTCNCNNPLEDDDASSQASEKLPNKRNRGHWYAVTKGRRIGVFSNRRDLLKSIKGFKGAIWKRFRSEQAAHLWLAEQCQPEGADDDSVSGDTWATRVEPLEGIPLEVGSDDAPRKALPTNQIADFSTMGPDRSVGKSKEIHGTSIQIEPEILKKLCPKGVTVAVRKELMEASVDVLTLPGKLNTAINAAAAEGSLIFDQFAEAVGDLNDVSARRVGAATRDTQWKLASKNTLEKVKTIEDCNTAADELSCEAETVLANMDASMKEILYAAGWAAQDTDSFCLIGLLPRIIRATMSLYQELYLVFQRLAVAHPNQWDEVGLEYVTHHAKAFARIRKCAQTRSQMILQNYTYLRDAKTKNFTDMKLLGALSLRWHIMAMAAATAAPPKTLVSGKPPPHPPLFGHVPTVILWTYMRWGKEMSST
jgi:hypothetical protein